ncbi:MAG: ankyrin repeat domain-containing protein [Syntrophorhabdales bacterium]|jgi:ankyrin repeat protein
MASSIIRVIENREAKKEEWAKEERRIRQRAMDYALLFACRGGDWRTAQFTIQKLGADPNTRASSFLPSLHSSIRYMSANKMDIEIHKKCVEILLDAKADVSMRDGEGSTALALAIDKGCIEIVDLLIDRKAAIVDVDAAPCGRNIFEYVAGKRRSDRHMVDLLRKKFPDLFLDWWTAATAPTVSP